VALTAALICAPFIRAVFSLADEGILLNAAEHLLHGDRIYADFFEFLPPGGFVLTALWFSLTGVSFLSARLMVVLTIIGIACFIFLACRKASGNAPVSALLATAWVLVTQGMWTEVSHHWFTTFFSMVTVWAAFAGIASDPGAARWKLIAGTAGGMAAMVTPTNGALTVAGAVAAFFTPPRPWAGLIPYVAACALIPLCFIAWLIWIHAFAVAFYDIIPFTATRYASIQSVPFGYGLNLQTCPLVLLFPLAAGLAVAVFARDVHALGWRKPSRDRTLPLAVVFGLAGLASSFPRPDCFHLGFTAPLACPLFAVSIVRLTKRWSNPCRHALTGAMIACLAPAAFYLTAVGNRVVHEPTLSTPRGEVAIFSQPGLPETLARLATMPAEDGYFFYPYMPLLPFLADRHHVSKHDIFTPGYTLPAQYRDVCLAILHDANWAVINRQWMDPAFWKQLFPAMRNPAPPESTTFERALNRNFAFVAREGPFEFRRRRDDASEAACQDIMD
jgi:hypothetical protein